MMTPDDRRTVIVLIFGMCIVVGFVVMLFAMRMSEI